MIKYQISEFSINTSRNVKKNGIALNILDDLDRVMDLIIDLSKYFPKINIVFRMHPRDSKIFNAENHNIIFSDSKSESVLHFINNIDLLIAGETSTHLEAVLMNVVPVYYKFSENCLRDTYGFIENELVFYLKDKKDLYKFLEKEIVLKSDVVERTHNYNEYTRNQINYNLVLSKYGI